MTSQQPSRKSSTDQNAPLLDISYLSDATADQSDLITTIIDKVPQMNKKLCDLYWFFKWESSASHNILLNAKDLKLIGFPLLKSHQCLHASPLIRPQNKTSLFVFHFRQRYSYITREGLEAANTHYLTSKQVFPQRMGAYIRNVISHIR